MTVFMFKIALKIATCFSIKETSGYLFGYDHESIYIIFISLSWKEFLYLPSYSELLPNVFFLENDPIFAHHGWVLCKFCTYDGCLFHDSPWRVLASGAHICSKFPSEYPPLHLHLGIWGLCLYLLEAPLQWKSKYDHDDNQIGQDHLDEWLCALGFHRQWRENIT